MARQAQKNTNAAQAQAQARLNFAKCDENFINDFNTVGTSILEYKVAEYELAQAKESYTGAKKDSDGKMLDSFKTYLKPYNETLQDAKKQAIKYASRFLAYYGQSRHSFSLDSSDAVIDLQSLLENMGVIEGDIADITKEKQVAMLQGLMTQITGRVVTTATKQAKGNNVLKFGRMKILKDNVIDTFLMLEVGLTAYTCLKSVYEDGTPLATVNENGNVIQTGKARQARTLVNTVKTQAQAK